MLEKQVRFTWLRNDEAIKSNLERDAKSFNAVWEAVVF